MRIRTKNVIPNVNNFRNIDCKVVAKINHFNLVDLTFSIRYEFEVPKPILDPNTNEEIGTELMYEEIHDFPIQHVTKQDINQLIHSIGMDLNANAQYIENIQTVMHEAFRIKVGMDGRFGLTPDDWERI